MRVPHGCITTPPALKGEVERSTFNDSEHGATKLRRAGRSQQQVAQEKSSLVAPDWDPKSR
eukprot:4863779-Alexandrium_andersonii.AAC.1